MGTYTYYCEVTRDRADIRSGVYSVVTEGWNAHWYTTLNRLTTASERVWKQGPQGGVRLIKEPWQGDKFYGRKYLTTNPEAMKEFAWVKIRAKAVDGT